MAASPADVRDVRPATPASPVGGSRPPGSRWSFRAAGTPGGVGGPIAGALLVLGAALRAAAPVAGIADGGPAPVGAATVAVVVAAVVPVVLVLAVVLSAVVVPLLRAAPAARRPDRPAGPTRRDRAPARLRLPALVAGLAVTAPAVLVGDLAPLLAPETASRPELVRPAGLAALIPGPGTALLLAGDAVLVLAAGLALVALRAHGSVPDPATGAAGRVGAIGPVGAVGAVGAVDAVDPREARGPSGRGVLAVAGALVAALGVVAAPFSAAGPPGASAGFDPRAALDTPAPAGLGAGLLALTVVVAALAAASAGPRVRPAALAGLAVALAAGVVPVLVASALTPGLAVSVGPPAVLVGALVIGLAAVPGPGATPAGRAARAGLRARGPGLAALLTAAACVVAAAAPTLALPAGVVPAPGVEGSGRLLWAAAVVLAVPGVLVAVGSPRLGVRVRPVLSVGWVAVPFAAGSALDVVLAGLDAGGASGVGLAAGGWAVVAAVLLSVVTAVLAVAAGASERAGRSAPAEPDRTMLPVAAVAAVLAVPALGGPLVRDALGTVGRPWADASAASWGALGGLLAVAVAALLAPRARPVRALGLLAGASSLLVVRLSALVLTPPGPGEQVGPGTWAAAGCLLALLAAAGVAASAVWARRPGPDGGPGGGPRDVSGVAPVRGTAPGGRG